MPVTFVGKASASSDLSANTVTVPAGAVTGDLLLAVAVNSQSGAPATVPAGFTSVYAAAVSGMNVAVSYRVRQGGDSASYSFATGGGFVPSDGGSASLSAYRGVDASTPFDKSLSRVGTILTPIALALTATRLGSLYVNVVAVRNSQLNAVVPSALTERLRTSGGAPSAQSVSDILATSSTTERVYEGTATNNVSVSMFFRVANSAPNAPTLVSPIGNTVIDQGSAQRLDWDHSDPDGDVQAAYTLRYRIVGAAAWTTVTASSPASHRDFAAGFFALGSYEWQVATSDATLTGPFSASGFFTVAAAPAGPSITAPANGSTVAAGSATVTWSASSQDAYQLRTVADDLDVPNTAVVYHDTGVVEPAAGGDTARSAVVPFAVNSRTEHIQLRTRVGGLWSPYASVRVLVSYTPPPTPILALTPSDDTGSIGVLIAAAAPSGGQPAVQSFDLFRRQAGIGEGIRIATARGAGTFGDFTPASGVDYEYRAVAFGDNGTTATSPWAGGADAVPPVLVIEGEEGRFADARFSPARFN